MFEYVSLDSMVLAGICLLGLVMVFRGFRLSKDFHARDAQRRELKKRLEENERQQAEEENG
jgi:hypothetical protein